MLCTFKWRIKRFGHTEGLKRSDMKNHLSLTEQHQNHLFPQTRHNSPSILTPNFNGFSILIIIFYSDWIVVLRIKICFILYNFTFGWPQYQTSAKKCVCCKNTHLCHLYQHHREAVLDPWYVFICVHVHVVRQYIISY